jgi:hypothetical protein
MLDIQVIDEPASASATVALEQVRSRLLSATNRSAFSNELTEAITRLVSKRHDESAPGGR